MADKPPRPKRRVLRWTLRLLALATVLIVLASFYQPPARLMPTPQAFLDGQPNLFARNPAQANDSRIEFFYATNRLPVGPRTNRLYAVVPTRDLNLGVGTIKIGDEATTWEKIYALSTGSSDDRRPFLRLQTMAELATIPEGGGLTPGARAWFGLIDTALARSADKDIIIFVHGANSSVERGAGQGAQLGHFTGRNSVVLLFAWPTAENFLRYPSDVKTAFGAAPQLARLIELLAANTNAHHIDVLTYSAGGTVGSEGLALVGRHARQPGAIDPRLGEVYHAAPDADTRGFVDDMRDYAGIARRVTVSANMDDITLRLSQIINRASRAGRPDMTELSPNATRWLLAATDQYGLELVQVYPEAMPGLSRWSHSFWYNDPWVSSDVLLTLLFHRSPTQRALVPGVSDGGHRYWTFPKDYPEQLPGVVAQLGAPAAAAPVTGAAPAAITAHP